MLRGAGPAEPAAANLRLEVCAIEAWEEYDGVRLGPGDALLLRTGRLGRWDFLLVIAPLRVPGGTGSPVNPIAVF